ncbi:MAG: competence protein ComEC [Verrucomicrobiaceae bacterium]|nr:competence protein ComEC [Verrucomicrobiaceae bacterium]
MLCMALGIGAVAWLPQLPSPATLLATSALVLVTCRWYRRQWWIALFALLLGLSWGTAFGHYLCAGILPAAQEQQSLLLQGRVSGLVEQELGFDQKPVLRFQFDVDECSSAPSVRCDQAPRQVKLSWYEAPVMPAAGERWQLRVKLRRPRGFANPAGFDYEAWLVANRIGAVGYVERSPDNLRRQIASQLSIDSWREQARNYLQRRLEHFAHRDLLLGLLVGDGSAINQASWKTFGATGTVHLFVVSGLQIAFTGGLVLWLSRQWWRSPFAVSTRRSSWLGALPAMAVALIYAALAGFGLPIQRALIMFAILLWALVGRREITASTGWIFSLWIVLVFDPLAVLDIGFWFSFIAVAALLLAIAGQRTQRPSRWRWWRAQSAVFAASLPVLLALSGQFTLLSLPANLVAIPLSTLLSMPLAFLALIADTITPVVGNFLWQCADRTLDWLVLYLEWLQLHGSVWIWHAAGVSVLSITCAAALALLLLLPRGMPGRAFALFFLVPLLWPRIEPIAEGAVRVTVVDVGQGLAVLVETAGHRLLYDTGPPFGPERTVAELAISPLLRWRGIDRLDTVVVSHHDNDHAGGWPDIEREFDVGRLLIGENIGAVHAEFCQAGMRWRWNAVEFEMLYPTASERSENTHQRGNNASCVLQVRAGNDTILLTGDIENRAEINLLNNSDFQHITLMIAPHHGSNSSSTPAFIARTQPRYVVFSSGYLNRFHHPHPRVEQRYREAGAASFNTATDGALIFDFNGAAVPQITAQRSQLRHYWD